MADPGSTILNLPLTVVLNDGDAIPLARPSGTSAPGSDLGLSGAALKGIITNLAIKSGLFRGPYAPGVAYGQYDGILIPAGNPGAGLLAYATFAFTSVGAYAASNWTLDPGQSTNDYTSPEKAKLASLYNAGPATTTTTGVVKIGANVSVLSDGTISVATPAPLYATTGQAIDGAMTQKAVTDAIGPIIGVTLAGLQTAYATAQQAADAMNAAGGGVVFSKVDIAGPLVLTGNTSLYAPGRAVYCHSTATVDTLTLNTVTGSVECRLVERSQAGVGSAIVVSGGTVTIKANVMLTQNGLGIFATKASTVDFTGNIDLTNPDTTTSTGTKFGILAYLGGSITMRGDIILRSALSDYLALEAFNDSTILYNGNIQITNKGRLALCQGGIMSLRGTLVSADLGVRSLAGKLDIYASIDTRSAPTPTAVNAPLDVVPSAAATASSYTQLHTGAELFAPAGVPSIYNSNSTVGVYTVLASGIFVSNTLPDAFTSVSYLTSQTLDTLSPLLYAASIVIDFNAESVRTLNATGNVAFGASLNVTPLRTKELYLTNATTGPINLTYPAGWTFFPGPASTSLAAGKQAVISLRSLGTSDSNVKAAFVAQA